MENPNSLRAWLEKYAPESIRADVVAACCNRGRDSGRLLKSVPTKKGPSVVGAWRAMMSELCVQRSGSFALLWASEEERNSFNRVGDWLSAEHDVLGISPGNVVRWAGGRPLEYSMLHWNADPAKLRALASIVDIDPEAFGLSFFD